MIGESQALSTKFVHSDYQLMKTMRLTCLVFDYPKIRHVCPVHAYALPSTYIYIYKILLMSQLWTWQHLPNSLRFHRMHFDLRGLLNDLAVWATWLPRPASLEKRA
jgi:hypothetical protein